MKYKNMYKEEIEKLVENIHAELKIEDMPVPVEEIVAKLGMKIKMAPSQDFSGLLLRKAEGALIGVNSEESPLGQRFTIAHELGHFFLHKSKDAFVDHRHRGFAKDEKEKEANVFAAAFLMPRKKITADIKELISNGISEVEIESLSKKYEVSQEAMTYRLINLGLCKK